MKSTRIGLLDTGVDDSHPALQGKVERFACLNRHGNWVTDQLCHDRFGHGTHTAGIICSKAFGFDTTAINLNVAAITQTGDVLLNLLKGLDQLLQWDMDIACLPIGVKAKTPIFKPFIDALVKKGVLVVVATGNEGDGRFHSPGWYPNVLSVGAVDGYGRLADFSGSYYDKRGRRLKPDIVAPGVNIPSAMPGGKTEQQSGTSMACAYVAGFAARQKQLNPKCNGAALHALVLGSTDPMVKRLAKKPPTAKDDLLFSQRYLDPYFERKLRCANTTDELESIVVFDGVLEQNQTSHITRFVTVDVAHVCAPKSYYQQLLDLPGLRMISAVDISLFD